VVILDEAVSVIGLGVAGRASGNVLVDRRHLLVPADTEATALGHVKIKLHAQNAGSASGGDETGVAVGAEFLGDNQLNDKVVLDFEATGSLHVADGVGGGIDASFELHADLATGSIKVGLPTILLLVVTNDASLLVHNTLALASNLVEVLGACSGDNLLVLFNAPHHLAKTPAGLSFVTLVDDTTEGHLDGELPNGVDNGRKNDTAGKVGRREDADGRLVVAGK
jgi:hypothetical protein